MAIAAGYANLGAIFLMAEAMLRRDRRAAIALPALVSRVHALAQNPCEDASAPPRRMQSAPASAAVVRAARIARRSGRVRPAGAPARTV